jgi:hypothetical protein
MHDRKTNLLDALERFISQRPNLGPANYMASNDDGWGRAAYRADCRKIAKDLQAARLMLRHARGSNITADEILAEADRRLTIRETPEGFEVDYCQGQFFAMEYRAAAAHLLASAFWNYWRSPGENARERIQNTARSVFGPAIQKQFFV